MGDIGAIIIFESVNKFLQSTFLAEVVAGKSRDERHATVETLFDNVVAIRLVVCAWKVAETMYAYVRVVAHEQSAAAECTLCRQYDVAEANDYFSQRRQKEFVSMASISH